jgi:hypothetical protein
MPTEWDEQIDADVGKVEEECGQVARSPFVAMVVYLTIIVLVVVFGIGIVELWRWAK